MTFTHCTRAQFAARLRERFRLARGVEALRLAQWIGANLTDAEIKAVWGLTNAQLTALKSRFASKSALLSQVDAAGGE